MEVHACPAQLFTATVQDAKILQLAFTATLLSLPMDPTALNAQKAAYPATTLPAPFATMDTT